MKKKLLTIMMSMAIVTAFTACNNAADETKEADKEKIHDVHDGDNHKKDDGHQHDSTHKNDTDTMGMKMGGNELDSKKK
jgi:Ni/Co efflux regulator RcnB